MKIKIRPIIALKEHSGAMVAVMIPKGFTDVLGASKDSFAPGSKFVPKSEYHITLAYLGDAADLSAEELSRIRSVISKIAANTAPFWMYLGGVGRFPNVEDGKYDAVYVKVRSHGLQQLFTQIKSEIENVNPEWYAKHEEYTPHMTLAYVPPGSEDTAEIAETEILVDRLSLVIAGESVNYVLRGDSKRVVKQVLTFAQV